MQFAFPRAATTLLSEVAAASGLVLPAGDLEPAASQAERDVAVQIAGNDEFATVVAALEQQYDQIAAGAVATVDGGLAGQLLPSADELAAQVEQFLSSLPDEDGADPAG